MRGQTHGVTQRNTLLILLHVAPGSPGTIRLLADTTQRFQKEGVGLFTGGRLLALDTR